MPKECDDEFCENPDPQKAFQQPLDRPSSVTYGTSLLRLMHIMDMILHIVVSICVVLLRNPV
jgi:hypothetical protein